jgi:hypothetical protein
MHTLNFSTIAAVKLQCQQPDDEMMLQLALMSEFILSQVNKQINETLLHFYIYIYSYTLFTRL